jgi:hypothetical protein
MLRLQIEMEELFPQEPRGIQLPVLNANLPMDRGMGASGD